MAGNLDKIYDSIQSVATAVEANRELIIERASMLANRITTSTGKEVPWLFAIFPDDRKKGFVKRPKSWMKKELRIHLLCNGRADLGVHPHFLFKDVDELHGKRPNGLYRGYRLLEPSKALKKWAPVLKVLFGVLSLAAKVAASVIVPGLGNAIPGLQLLFGHDDDDWDDMMDDSVEKVQAQFGAVCDTLIETMEHSGPAVDKWEIPEEAAFKKMQGDLADFIIKRDQKHRYGARIG